MPNRGCLNEIAAEQGFENCIIIAPFCIIALAMKTLNAEHSAPAFSDAAALSGTASATDHAFGFKTSELRKDFKTAEIVEKAIKLQESLSTMAAATYLKANGVDFDVTFRVLNRPSQRRKSQE